MNTRNPRAEQLFAAVLELDRSERGDFLDRECAGDAALRREVESLLGAHEQSGAFLGSADLSPAFDLTTPTEKTGDRIGRYKLLEKIGEGGFGDVWMAEQEEPVRRRVALKIIKLGMDTREVVARFEAERHALALLEPK